MTEHYYNEIDPYCCKVLRARIADGSLPYGFVDERDIREVRAHDLKGYTQCHFFAGIGGFPLGLKWAGADGIRGLWTGGFPCQDISLAGTRAGLDGSRSGLWHTWHNLFGEDGPNILLVENTAGLLIPIDEFTPAPISRILGDLAVKGYDAEWDRICPCWFGAPHGRDRVWIVAHARSHRAERLFGFGGETGCNRQGRAFIEASMCDWPTRWKDEAFGAGETSAIIRGEDDGLPNRLDRIGALGNAVVPQVVEYIGRAILNARGGK